jgi:hypothetical protein
MSGPARRLRWRGIGEYRDQAEPLLEAAGDVAGIVRGRPRSLIMKCPDGCGDTLVINLDPRAGKAWFVDVRGERLSLYPSVWREDGCQSHFILWRDHILWCGRYEDDNVEPVYDPDLEAAVIRLLSVSRYRSSLEIASELGEIPWEVSRVLRRFARDGRAEEGEATLKDRFRLKRPHDGKPGGE